MWRSKASIWPVSARPSLIVTLSRQLIRESIFPPLDFGGGYIGYGINPVSVVRHREGAGLTMMDNVLGNDLDAIPQQFNFHQTRTNSDIKLSGLSRCHADN